MANSIAYVKNYTDIIDRVYQRASVSSCLNSGRRMVRAGRNAREVYYVIKEQNRSINSA